MAIYRVPPPQPAPAKEPAPPRSMIELRKREPAQTPDVATMRQERRREDDRATFAAIAGFLGLIAAALAWAFLM